jgi:sulfotransferase family protein
MQEPLVNADPVFVLCTARSGSTLLRFLLDAHPDLACPPETELPLLCLQLTQTWALLAGTPMQKSRNGEPPVIPEPLRVSVRFAMSQLIGQHLARRGKKRFCDKSLFTAKHVGLLTQLFPEAKFICLYRHPMDMIASGIEACPWGLKGFGFDSYAASSPGSDVLALARFWADHAREIREVEERYPQRCCRVRYEDLVDDPEAVADGVFGFLGVPPSSGISVRCFTPERERLGPGDYKIWQTSRITADSVGRGWSIPADQIERSVLDRINQLANQLGYVRIDEKWSVADTPPDLRVSDGGAAPRDPVPSARGTRQMPRAFLLLGDRLQTGLFRVSDRFVRAWGSCAGESFLVVATSPVGDDRVARWRVDLAARTVTLADVSGDRGTADGGVAWQLTGSAATWEQVLAGTANLNVTLRHRELRYADTGTTPGPVTVTRIGMLADLLGITSWRSAEGPAPAHTPSAA